MKVVPFLSLIFCLSRSFSFEISPIPLQEVPILEPENCPKSFGIKYAGDKPRLSSCTGAAWTPDESILIVAQYDYGTLNVYEFDHEKKKVELVQTVESSEKLNLQSVENLIMSPNGSWVALTICHTKSVVIFEFDKLKNRINPSNYYVFESPEQAHGINFSRDSKYLLFTTVGSKGGIYVCKFNEMNHKCSLEYLMNIRNDYYPLKPKSIDFSYDGNYLVAIYANNVGKKKSVYDGKIAVYEFDKNEGKVNKASVSVLNSNDSFAGGDDVRFYKNSYKLIVSEQSLDKVSVYDFDPVEKTITKSEQELNREISNISLPHGIAISPSGKYLVVCNYGLNNFLIFSIE